MAMKWTEAYTTFDILIKSEASRANMSSTTTTTQSATKAANNSVLHMSPQTSTSSLPTLNLHRPKHLSPQDSLSSTKSGPTIPSVVPSPRHLSPQASFTRDDPRAYMASLLTNVDSAGDRPRTVVSRSDTVSSSCPSSSARDARFFLCCEIDIYKHLFYGGSCSFL